jgi:antitoxin component YwqK of YwqJK toxin-antitoxin module
MHGTEPAVPSEPAVPAKRTAPRRWRRIFQFSLRTLLILTTLAAVGCWWYLQPKIHVEELAGGALKLRRVARERGKNEFFGRSARRDMLVNLGSWQLRDKQGEALATGRYVNDQPHGFWKVFHPNGRKAAEGQMFQGLRVGVWRTWDERGQRESEATYVIMKPAVATPELPSFRPSKSRPPVSLPIPVVGMIGALGNMPPVATMLMGGLPGKVGATVGLVSLRHGQAKAWYANGQLKESGSYRYDRRDGTWKFYDEHGRVVGAGEYRDGLREGEWSVLDAASGQMKIVEFIGDRPRDGHERLMADLQAELASGQIERQVVAMDRLERLNAHGLPHLVNALSDPRGDIQLLALRRLNRLLTTPRMAGDATRPVVDAATMGRIESLIDSDDERVARLALLVVYREIADRRDALFPQLIESIRQAPDGDWAFHALALAWTSDTARRPTLFNELAEAVDRWSPEGLSSSVDYWYFVQASQSNELNELLFRAMSSDLAKVRGLAIQWISLLALRHPEYTKQSDGSRSAFYPIPEPFRDVVEAARRDPDEGVRRTAENMKRGAAEPKPK